MSTTTAPPRVDERSPADRDARPWSRYAACAGKTALFFPPPGEGSDARGLRELRACRICAECPVLAPCRAWAREHGEYGFWGGESEEARAAAGFRTRIPRTDRHQRRIGPHRVA